MRNLDSDRPCQLYEIIAIFRLRGKRALIKHAGCEDRSSQTTLIFSETPMDLQLTNKKALVSGSTAGIGFAIASLLAQEGATVVVNGRSQGRVEEAVQRIKKDSKDAQVMGVAADLGTKEGEE